MMNNFRIAVVQPLREKDEDVKKALEYFHEAVNQRAMMICFPEGYPGPWSGGGGVHSSISQKSIEYTSLEEYPAVKAFTREARDHNVYVTLGLTEREGNNYYNSYLLIGPHGKVIGKHRKTTPAAFERLGDGRIVSKGNELNVFKTEYANIGLLICWEALFPELSRILALKGAEIMVYPTGGKLYELMETWRTVIWARAIENLSYVAFCVNLFGKEKGMAMIAGPEEILAETDKEGVITADLDLDRLRWLRETEESMDIPKKYKCVPGLFRYRRPELYKLLSERQSLHMENKEEEA